MTVVRPATAADARGIAETRVESWRATYAGVVPQSVLDELDVDVITQGWSEGLERASADAATYVADSDGTVVGFVHAGPDGDVARVYAIYARPSVWDRGVGRALMDEAVRWMGKRWDDAILWVAEENPRGRRFYERYGWLADGGRMVDEVAPGVYVAEIRYRLSLLGRG